MYFIPPFVNLIKLKHKPVKTLQWEFIWYPSFLKIYFHLSNFRELIWRIVSLRHAASHFGKYLKIAWFSLWYDFQGSFDAIYKVHSWTAHQLWLKTEVSHLPGLIWKWGIQAEIWFITRSQGIKLGSKEVGWLQVDCFSVHMLMLKRLPEVISWLHLHF